MATAKLSSNSQLGGASKGNSELKQRLIFLILAMIVYRICSHIPVPGINPGNLATLFNENQSGLLGLMNLFSGGAVSRFSIVAIGITPYITSSIVMQLAAVVVPSLEALKKEGQAGQRKIIQYTRYGTLGLALIQAFFVASSLQGQDPQVLQSGVSVLAIAVLTLVTGTMFLMWLGEQITERGLGNGISLIIFTGIVSSLPSAISGFFEKVGSGQIGYFSSVLIILLAVALIAFIVFVERALRKIPINYAKRQVGNKVYGGQSSFLPLKLNMASVIPAIFASSILLFPATIANAMTSSTSVWLKDLAAELSPGKPLHLTLYVTTIMFFSFFYTALMFNSRDTSDNLKKSGAVIPGIRPGEQTTRYLDKIILRLTLIGAAYMAFVCVVPELMAAQWSSSLAFGGTSLLIIVVVAMDFMSQVQSSMMSSQYESLMKKANFKGSK